MRKLLIVLLATFAIGTSYAQQSKKDAIKNLASDCITFSEDELSEGTPIESFNTVANQKADKVIELTKENMAESLEAAKGYKACFITVKGHTIVKVTDFEKTIMSGSWGCKLPFGKGYVQKAGLNEKEDYINNIIGIPGSQTRQMFLFN
jgi:hypothetical protein